ncbi:MAG: YecA family protein [Burkholderiaceae bacterium]
MSDAAVSDAEREELQVLLDSVPAPLEPLDVSMLDGFLCGVLVQPSAVPAAQWLPWVTDIDGRRLPPGFDPTRLHQLVSRRHSELDRAIARREWFDPWVFELDEEGSADASQAAESALEAVYPWVAGFTAAMNAFPGLLAQPVHALTEPLALLYRHLDPDDLDDADDLLEAVEALAPLVDLSEAVEHLVRATFLLADVARPLAPSVAPRRTPAAKATHPRRRR